MVTEVLQFPIRVRRSVHCRQLACQETDLLRFVANSLQVGNGLDDCNDEAEVTGGRRACRENPAAFLVDTDLELVDLVIVVRNLQIFNVFVETPRYMIGEIGCFHSMSLVTRAAAESRPSNV